MIEQERSKTFGALAIALGIISLIPIIGIIFGILAIIFGIFDIRKTTSKTGIIGIILGSLGFLISVTLLCVYIYMGMIQRGGVYDELRIKTNIESSLPMTIKLIEKYKKKYKKYPDHISELNKITKFPLYILDQLETPRNAFNTNIKDSYFFYQRISDSTYYLFSRGIDGIPFTKDDLFPAVNKSDSTIGYRNPNH